MILVRRLVLAGFALLLVPIFVPAQDPAKKEVKEPETVSYYKDVRPIFQQHCQGCHQPAKAEGSFLMTSHADLFKKGDNEQPGVVAGHPNKSFLITQITSQDGKPPAMPRGKDPLTAHQVTLIKKWI